MALTIKKQQLSGSLTRKPVIFNRGSAEPKGSVSICQRFRSWSV